MIEIRCWAPKVVRVEYTEEWLWGLAASGPARRDFLEISTAAAVLAALTAKKPLVGGGVASDLVKRIVQQLQDEQPASKKKLKAEAVKVIRSSTRKLPVSLLSRESLFDFHSLPRDGAAACDFLQRYGLFRNEDLKRPGDLPAPIQEFWEASVKKKETPFALRTGGLWKEQESLKTLLKIFGGLEIGEKENLRRADELAYQLGYPSATVALEMELVWYLGGATVSLDFEGAVGRPFLATYHVLPGIYAHLWNRFVEGCPPRECLKCGKAFGMDRPRKRYCSPSCQQADKQRRYRENLAKKAKKKK